jgi:hypothetical protein
MRHHTAVPAFRSDAAFLVCGAPLRGQTVDIVLVKQRGRRY